MLLREVKNLIEEKREICLSEIYSSIDGDKGLIDQALFELSEKGIIKELNSERACKGCPMKCESRGEKIFRIL